MNKTYEKIEIAAIVILVILIAALLLTRGASCEPDYIQEQQAEAASTKLREDQRMVEETASYYESQGREVDYDGEWIVVKTNKTVR